MRLRQRQTTIEPPAVDERWPLLAELLERRTLSDELAWTGERHGWDFDTQLDEGISVHVQLGGGTYLRVTAGGVSDQGRVEAPGLVEAIRVQLERNRGAVLDAAIRDLEDMRF